MLTKCSMKNLSRIITRSMHIYYNSTVGHWRPMLAYRDLLKAKCIFNLCSIIRTSNELHMIPPPSKVRRTVCMSFLLIEKAPRHVETIKFLLFSRSLPDAQHGEIWMKILLQLWREICSRDEKNPHTSGVSCPRAMNI